MPEISERIFYRTVRQIEVISETPLSDDLTITDLDQEIIYGDSSGVVTSLVANEAIDAKQAAAALLAHGSDPEFFKLTPDGKDTYAEEKTFVPDGSVKAG